MFVLNKELKVKLPDCNYVFKKGTPCQILCYHNHTRKVMIKLPGKGAEICCKVKASYVEEV